MCRRRERWCCMRHIGSGGGVELQTPEGTRAGEAAQRTGLLMRRHAMALSLAWMAVAAPAIAQQGSVVASSAGQTAAHASVPETKFEVPDAARRAILFTKYALDVRLETQDATLHARAIVTVKNESATALEAIPLQISSSLHWEAIDAEGKPLRFAHHTVATDADHTGAMNEALVTLASPLAPGGEQTLTVFYSGSVAPTATAADEHRDAARCGDSMRTGMAFARSSRGCAASAMCCGIRYRACRWRWATATVSFARSA